jgi:hypothetical protein
MNSQYWLRSETSSERQHRMRFRALTHLFIA